MCYKAFTVLVILKWDLNPLPQICKTVITIMSYQIKCFGQLVALCHGNLKLVTAAVVLTSDLSCSWYGRDQSVLCWIKSSLVMRSDGSGVG
jgi:hypothetical protein